MIQQQRYAEILAHLNEHEFLSVEDAVTLIAASPATVRRDFNQMTLENLVDRTRGGIRRKKIWANGLTPYALRAARHAREKHALARKAVTLLRPGDVIMVDGGTTTFHITDCLPDFPLRIITNSLHLASTLGEQRFGGKAAVDVFLSGGHLYPQSGQLIGPQARASIAQYYANWVFLSVGGIDGESFYYSNELVVETEQAMMANADKVVILADHSKIGARAMCHLCELDRADILITDTRMEHESMYERIREAGVEIILVDVENSELASNQ